MRLKIVTAVHDPPVWTLPASEVQRIAQALPETEVVDARTPEERLRAFPSADVLFATRLSREEAQGATKLRWIQSSAVGVGPLLVPEVVNGNVLVTNARGLHADFIAEHAVALALAVRRGLHTSVQRQVSQVWAQTELQAVPCAPSYDSQFLVVGLGEIGSRVARMASGLGFRVIGIRRRVDLPRPRGVTRVAGPEHLKRELRDADVVVLATPRTTETRAMVGAEELAVMKPTAVLVNVGRGRLVDETALVHALEEKKIAGAGLDAFEREPLPSDHALWRLPNVLMSPHVAAFGADYWTPAVDLFIDNVRRFIRGEALVNLVDKQGGY